MLVQPNEIFLNTNESLNNNIILKVVTNEKGQAVGEDVTIIC